MGDLHALQARIAAATGPDRELDAEIDAALFGGVPSHQCQNITRQSYGPGYVHANDDPSKFVWGGRHAARITASIDAADALVARILPGWDIECGRHKDIAMAAVGLGHRSFRESHLGGTPLAIIAALLAALQSERRPA